VLVCERSCRLAVPGTVESGRCVNRTFEMIRGDRVSGFGILCDYFPDQNTVLGGLFSELDISPKLLIFNLLIRQASAGHIYILLQLMTGKGDADLR
jgi:hypothetical protein